MNDSVIKKTTGLKAVRIEDLNVDYYVADVQKRRQTGKKILRSAGQWVAIAFRFQESEGDGWGPERVMLAMFKSMSGMYTRYSYFIVKHEREAFEICAVLVECFRRGHETVPELL